MKVSFKLFEKNTHIERVLKSAYKYKTTLYHKLSINISQPSLKIKCMQYQNYQDHFLWEKFTFNQDV